MVLASLTGGIAYLLSDFALDTYDTVDYINGFFWGALGAVIIATPFYFTKKSLRKNVKKTLKNDWKVLTLVSFLTFIGALIWWYTIAETSSGLVSLLGESRTLFVFILGVTFLKEKCGKRLIRKRARSF